MATTINSGYADSPKLTANIADHADVFGGRALVFDGVVDYLTLGNSSIFNHSGNYSISVWIKKIGQPNANVDTNANPTIIAKGNVYFTLFVNFDGMLGTFFYNNSNATDYNIKTADGVIKLNVWHHVVLTWNSTSSQLYVDGKQEYSGSYTPYNLNTGVNGTEIRIGDKESSTSDTKWHGNMCDMKIFDSHLTEAQVTELYRKPENTPSAVQDNLVAWYPMCEGNPESPQSIVYDHSEKGLGSELITDSGFDDASYWNEGGNWSVSGSKATSGTGTYDILQPSSGNFNLVNGRLYKFTASITLVSGSGNFAFFANDVSTALTLTSGTNTYTTYLTSDGAVPRIRMQGGSAIIEVDDFSVKKVLMGQNATTNFFGDELWDADASTFDSGTHSWIVYGSNTIANDSGALKVTYVDDSRGAYVWLKDASDLSTNLTVGTTYKFTFDAKVNSGSSVEVVIGGPAISVAVTETSFTSKSITFIATATDVNYVGMLNMGSGEIIYLDNFSLKEIGISSSGFDTAVNEPVVPQVPLMRYNQKMFFNEDDSYVDISGIGDVTGAFSWSVWINDIGNATQGYILGRSSGNDYLRLIGGRIQIRIAGSSDASFTPNGQYTHSDIRHIAVTRNSSNNLKLYVNGVEGKLYNGSAYVTGGVTNSGTSNIDYIGKETGSDTYRGLVNEFSIFNTELTQTQIQELFNDGVAYDATTHSQSANLIGYWRNDGVTTWKDRSTNSNDGSVQGSPDSITIREGLNANRDGLGFYFTSDTKNVLRLWGEHQEKLLLTNFGASFERATPITLMAWIKYPQVGGAVPDGKGAIFSHKTLQFQFSANLSNSGAKIRFLGKLGGGGTSEFQYYFDPTSPPSHMQSTELTDWIHIAFTVTGDVAVGSNEIGKIYLNGTLVHTDNSSVLTSNAIIADMSIGQDRSTSDYVYHYIDELMIYNKVLSASEVEKNYKYSKGKHKND